MRNRQWEQVESVIPDILEIQKEPLPIYKRDWLTGKETLFNQIEDERRIRMRIAQCASIQFLTENPVETF